MCNILLMYCRGIYLRIYKTRVLHTMYSSRRLHYDSEWNQSFKDSVCLYEIVERMTYYTFVLVVVPLGYAYLKRKCVFCRHLCCTLLNKLLRKKNAINFTKDLWNEALRKSMAFRFQFDVALY